ncbi:MAG TPA: transglycosylase SLT domain-containing protein [Bryobacteraceae bacterium]|nr:transglycosylase SLT domain-containing protein [Bryobacteraceae bacterium]
MCSVRTIPARWRKFARLLALAPALGPSLCAQDLASQVKAYRENPSVARRLRIERYAAAHSKDQSGALARLALGITSFEQKDDQRAISNLKAAGARLPQLADYAAYYLASAELAAKQEAAVPKDLDRGQGVPITSPLAARATVLRAKALVDLKNPAEAIRTLRERYADLPQPDADFTLATAYEALGDHANAAAYYQYVYFRHPDTDAAAQASAALLLLRESMGAAYPPATAAEMLERGDRWLAARDYPRARQEFLSIAGQLNGADRDLAMVRAGVADYMEGQTAAAYRYLQSLEPAHGEADAERLYYLAECHRAMNADDDRMDTVQRLSKQYPQSPWRLKALFSAANHYLVVNRPDIYVPLYQAVFESFPDDALAAYCHWKVAWAAYIQRHSDARDKLREQVDRYPSDPRVGAALYFLGRLSEADKDYGAARAYYDKIIAIFPNYYYANLARERLADTKLVAAQPGAKVVEYLNTVSFPERRVPAGLEPSATTRVRIERARLLLSAGLQDLAEGELRFGARNDGQPQLLAMELARTAGSPYMSLHYMKSFAPDYLATPIDRMPRRFWELLFPLPYQNDLVRNARLQNLDPYMVAALIRQESEFNPGAISHKSAYGLTQIMPATGRQLARRDGVRRFRSSMLFRPSTNLKLGSRYLRSMLDQWGGKWEQTLASYNAGKNRVLEWSGWDSFQEPAEFVETIPFTETRDYVQAVLRNAAIYKRLYGTTNAGVTSTHGLSSSREPRKARTARGSANRKRTRSVS